MSFLGDLLDRIRGDKADNVQRIVIRPEYCWDGRGAVVPTPAAVEADAAYVRLNLATMRLSFDNRWGSTWHPLVNSVVTVTFADTQVELPYAAGDSNIKDLDKGHLNRSVVVNQALSPLIPFRGGTVGVEAALVAIQGDNVIKDLIGVVGNFAAVLPGVPISSAVAIATPLVTSIQTLLGGRSGEIQLRLDQGFSGPIQPRYIAMLGPDQEQTLTDADLGVRDGALIHVVGEKPGSEYQGTNMVLQLEGREDRDDWDDFKTIESLFNKAVDAIWRDKPDEAEEQMTAAQAALAVLPDLTFRSRTQAPVKLRARFNQVVAAKKAGDPEIRTQSERGTALSEILAGL